MTTGRFNTSNKYYFDQKSMNLGKKNFNKIIRYSYLNSQKVEHFQKVYFVIFELQNY